MSPFKAFALALVLNVVAVLAMERIRQLWKAGTPAFEAEPLVWYVVLAVTIVVTQFFIVAASLNKGFPMNVAIGINIALVLAVATLNSCRVAGRWPTISEIATLAVLVAAAFALQFITAKAEQAHEGRQIAASDSVAEI